MNRLLILSVDAEKYSALIKEADLQQLEIRTASDIASARILIEGCNIVLGDPPLIDEVLASADSLARSASSHVLEVDCAELLVSTDPIFRSQKIPNNRGKSRET